MLNKILKKTYKIILYLMPKSLAHRILYRRRMGKTLNLNNPNDLNEKIHWLIINRYDKKYSDLADKYLVREYIKEKGYEFLLPKLYGVYDNANDIDFENLPRKFVLKPNNGCGNIFIFDGKEKNNLDDCRKNLNIALNQNFAIKNLEYHYSYIKPKIICEEYLYDGKNKVPLDYKFYCYDGRVECILLCSERDEKLKINYYDLEWNELDYVKEEYKSNKKYERPEQLEEMINIASKLSKGFDFVRVDLYNINGKVYFSELTFSPAAGGIININQSSLDYLGSLIDLKKRKTK